MLTAGLLSSSNVDLAQAATHFGAPSNYYAFTCKLEGQVLHLLLLKAHKIRKSTCCSYWGQ